MSRKTGDAICTWKYLGQFKKLGVCASMVPIWDLQDEKEEDLSGKIVIFAATNFFSAPFTNSNFQECNLNLREISSFPFPRRQEIPYVMVAYESPYNAKLETYKDFFNWTMSYRIDSDVFAPYGGLLRNSELVKVNYTEIWKSKTKGTLWLVSNNIVNNKRKKLVEKLIENGMKVDLYGKVYNREPDNCPRDGAQEGCDERFQSPYKFVIAFENSNCKDYVTEKFWRKAEQYKMVPI
ncbi:Protein CBR-FUT-5 [Caenorhabditis briggsae]|uniref:Fucosyltransferase n=1 Tax=Caenorhabditis briggsae TaxID=6238 RepID=A8XHS1_CAEBR|nr:Protein CBR-FUT-5 [Caenorhabditis briggsae]CAP32188.2 Protein CBR-FUT-5 [Caenorhabditis briggsae]